MGYILTDADKNNANQGVSGVSTKTTPGVFAYTEKEIKSPYGNGPAFSSQYRTKSSVDGIKKPENTPENMLESLSMDRILEGALGEIVNIAKLGDRATKKDRDAVVRFLQEANPRRYGAAKNNNVPEIPKITPKKEAPVTVSVNETIDSNEKTAENPVDISSIQPETATEISESTGELPKNEEISSLITPENEVVTTAESPSVFIEDAPTISLQEELTRPVEKIMETKEKLNEGELIYRQLHPSPISSSEKINTNTAEEITLEESKDEALVTAQEISTPENIDSTPLQEEALSVDVNPESLETKRIKVDRLLDVLLKNSEGYLWSLLYPDLNVKNAKSKPLPEDELVAKIPVKQEKPWYDSPKMRELAPFIGDITKLSEESLFAKYVQSYVNPNNPSSWSAVSKFEAYKIIYGELGIYGLPDDGRKEVSNIIKNTWEIDAAIAKKNSTFSDYVAAIEGETMGGLVSNTKQKIARASDQK